MMQYHYEQQLMLNLERFFNKVRDEKCVKHLCQQDRELQALIITIDGLKQSITRCKNAANKIV